MATLDEILDYEGNIERSFARISTQIDSNLAVFTSTDSPKESDLPTPRMEITATIDSLGPHQAVIGAGKDLAGLIHYDQINASVQMRVLVDQDWDQNRQRARGVLRQILLRFDLLNLALAHADGGNDLIYLASDSYRQTAGLREVVDEEGNVIGTQATVPAVFFINPDKWPDETVLEITPP